MRRRQRQEEEEEETHTRQVVEQVKGRQEAEERGGARAVGAGDLAKR